ncbi:unnamed protein product [Colias eurytheme]|nr:unnamed protein product [Colias eurytheme]
MRLTKYKKGSHVSLPVIHYDKLQANNAKTQQSAQSSLITKVIVSATTTVRLVAFAPKTFRSLFSELGLAGKWGSSHATRPSRACTESVLRGAGFRPPVDATGTGVRGYPRSQTPSASRRLASFSFLPLWRVSLRPSPAVQRLTPPMGGSDLPSEAATWPYLR